MEDGIIQQFQIFRLVMAVMMKCVCVGGGGGYFEQEWLVKRLVCAATELWQATTILTS